MKKRIILTLAITFILACLFVLSASAVESSLSNAFGTAQTLEGIDLTGMSTDTTSRVVLMHTATDEATGEAKAYYTTYPSQYIIKLSGDFNIDYSKINAALTDEGISYGSGSIIRIEIPTTVTKQTTNLNGNNKHGANLVEVVYPANSQVTELVWGAFLKCQKLEKVNIPASVTLLGQDCFSSCGSLQTVTFDKNSSLTTIDKSAFGSCVLLEEIVLPNTVTKIGNDIFFNCKKLQRVVLGANIVTTDGGLLGAAGYGDKEYFAEIYMPGGFATGEGSIQSGNILGRGNAGDLGKYVIFFTGTKEQALTLVSKYSSDPNIKDANIVAYDPQKSNNKSSYVGLTAYTEEKTINTNRVIVYGYNTCDAFYEGNHVQGAVETKFDGLAYASNLVKASTCNICQKNFVVENICGPLFIELGYSKPNDNSSFGYGVSVNQANIDKYIEATGDTLVYGFIIGLYSDKVADIISTEGESQISNSIVFDFSKPAYDNLDRFTLKFTSISDPSLKLCCNVYVIANSEKVSYLGAIDNKTLKPVAVTVATIPTKED